MLFLIGVFVTPSDSFSDYAFEMQKAEEYLIEHKALFDFASAEVGTSSLEIQAIVFPEVMRYQTIRNFIETKALELGYVQGGKSVADFSIGAFQMKPSFVEDLETEIDNNPELREKFPYLLTIHTLPEKEQRTERLKRLKSVHWQIYFVNAYLAVMEAKHPRLEKMKPESRISFLATGYNVGIHRSFSEIQRYAEVKGFPYGIKSGMALKSYADFSLQYFSTQNHSL